MRFLRQSLMGVLLAAISLTLVVFAVQRVTDALGERMAQDRRAPPPRERVFAVNTVQANFETITPVLEAFGQVQSRRTLEMRATTGGRVTWLAERFEDGGAVRAGDELLRIDPANAQSALDRAENDLLDAQAEVRDAQRSLVLARDELGEAEEQSRLRQLAYQRQQDLQTRGVATAAAVEDRELAAASARQAVFSRRMSVTQAEARIDQASTRLARAEIARDEAKRGLDDTLIIATFDATLSDVNVVEGRLVSPNEKLALLVDPQALEVAFQVSTAQYARLLDNRGELIGAPVRIRLDVGGADLTASGQISRDSAEVGDGQSGRTIYARLDKAPGFKPGDFVTVQADEPPLERVARLPSSALDAAGTVLVLGPENRLESLEVQLVRRQGDDVLIRGRGLMGRNIVVGRTPLLGAGIRVRPLAPPGEEPEAPTGPEMVELTSERRAALLAFVEGNNRMPKEIKDQLLGTLQREMVPAPLIQRLESRMGG